MTIKTREARPRREFKKESVEGKALCKKCGAVYADKRWTYDEKRYKELSEQKGILKTICTGCMLVEKKHIDGLVTLHSPKIKADKNQFVNLITNEAEKEKKKNPLSRIAELTHKGENIAIYTTTEFLAERLGRAVKKAYKGKLKIQKLSREKFVRVNWEG